MHPYKAIILLALMQAVAIASIAQNDTTAAIVNLSLQDNQAKFSSELRTLRRIAGAPSPFYSYFWEFGDGEFSFEENPKHIYKDTGLYNVRLYATNNYDDGKPPPTRPKPVHVNRKTMIAANKTPVFFKEGGAIEMKVNRMPKPGEDMVLIVGYRNDQASASLNGSLVLFYNEKEFRKNSFDLAEERAYHGETRSNLNTLIASAPMQDIMEAEATTVLSGPNPSVIHANEFHFKKFADVLKAKLQLFRKNNVWHFDNLQQGEEKYFYITLRTTPDMIRDTNGVVTLTGMFVPDDPNGKMEEYTLELPIVASHDPNRMILKNQRLNYRFTGANKEMTYRVRFQNTGKGPASQVRIGIAVPHVLDARSLELISTYPRTKWCDSVSGDQSCIDTIITKDSVWFVFKNIYLPGLHQEGFSDPDSTIGFVKYKMEFTKKPKKLPFDSRAEIVFDRNEPIYTNRARGDFKKGRSVGLVIGYNQLIGEADRKSDEENYWVAALTVSPYSPFRGFFQFEAYVGYRKEEFIGSDNTISDTIVNGVQYTVLSRDIQQQSQIFKLDLVPLHWRYNVNSFFGAGAGTLFAFDAYTRTKSTVDVQMAELPNPPVSAQNTTNKNSFFTDWDAALFVDVQFGRVRKSPLIGARVLHYFRYPQNRLFLYAAIRL